MKRIFIYSTFLLLGILYSFTGKNSEIPKNGVETCKASIIVIPEESEVAHFELAVAAESELVYYSLKREFADGRFETVEVLKIESVFPADELMPSFHHFEDVQIPNEDFTYMLLRIEPASRTHLVVQRWEYCAQTHSLCSTGILATN